MLFHEESSLYGGAPRFSFGQTWHDALFGNVTSAVSRRSACSRITIDTVSVAGRVTTAAVGLLRSKTDFS